MNQHHLPATAGATRCGRLAALVAVGLGFAAAGPALAANTFESPADGVYKDHIDFGTMMDMSGPASGSQAIWVNGYQDYMRKLNEAGGIHGRKVNVLAEDSRFNPAQDKINYEKLVGQTPVIAISGVGSSSSQASLAPTIRSGKVPIIGTYTTTKLLSEPVSPLVYGGFCGYPQMAQTGVGYYVDKLKLKTPKVMMVAIESAGGNEYHHYVDAAVKKLGGTLVAGDDEGHRRRRDAAGARDRRPEARLHHDLRRAQHRHPDDEDDAAVRAQHPGLRHLLPAVAADLRLDGREGRRQLQLRELLHPRRRRPVGRQQGNDGRRRQVRPRRDQGRHQLRRRLGRSARSPPRRSPRPAPSRRAPSWSSR